MANMLRRSLRMSLPEVLRGSGEDLFEASRGGDPNDIVLLIYINFSINEHRITGYIAMAMDLPALLSLRELLDGLISRMTPAASSPGHARH
jgi:chemotaxis protein CheC